MDRIRRLKLNKRLMFGTRFFLEIKSLNSVIQLFYLSRGLELNQIIYLSLVWSIVVFLSDIPSSILADKFGRKKLIITGAFLTSLSTILLFNANGFLLIALTYVLGAIGYSFFMGADQAILYDSLKEVGDEKNSSKVAGKYYSSQSLPKIIMPFIGGLIAKDLMPWQFNILILIDIFGSFISIGLASFLIEPKVESLKRKSLTLFKEGIDLIKKDKILLKLALNKIVVFQASFVYWRLYQVFLKNEGLGVVYLGLIYTIFQGIQFLLLWNTQKVQEFLGKVRFANIPSYAGFLSILLSIFSDNLIILFVSCVILLLTGVSRDPFFLTQIQSRIKSSNRATATSTLNIIKSASDIPLLLLIGFLAKIDINYVIITSGVLFLISILFLRIKKEELF